MVTISASLAIDTRLGARKLRKPRSSVQGGFPERSIPLGSPIAVAPKPGAPVGGKTMKSPVTRSRGLAIATVAAFAVALIPVGAATAAPAAKCDNRNNNTISKLLECVDADGAIEHLEAFQAIADANGDTRAAGTVGLRGERRLRRRHARGRGLERLDRRVRLHLRRPVDARAAHTGVGDLPDRSVHRYAATASVQGSRHPGRHPAHRRPRQRRAAARRPTSPDFTGDATSRSSSAARAPSATRRSTPRRRAQRPSSSSTRATRTADRAGPDRRHARRH